ncbi:hypothetical protein D3Z56_02765 [Lachnospiraceae bacterium]|nr:hypothetical protein [Lachnospiraceae bacterium]
MRCGHPPSFARSQKTGNGILGKKAALRLLFYEKIRKPKISFYKKSADNRHSSYKFICEILYFNASTSF